jgi:hypothetical protein
MYDDDCSIRVMRFFSGATRVLKEFDSLPLATDREEIHMRQILRRALVNSFRVELMSFSICNDDSGGACIVSSESCRESILMEKREVSANPSIVDRTWCDD